MMFEIAGDEENRIRKDDFATGCERDVDGNGGDIIIYLRKC